VAAAGTVALLAIGSTPAWAGHAGNGDNRGDAWVDAVGQGQVGHENDPHLGCNDIAIWGAMLNDASGPFTIQGWPPSGGGSREVDWSATWHYDTTAGGSQVIAVVPVHDLLANAMAAGDTAQPQQGFHFKLDLENPRTGASVGDDKYKVFWVDCASGVSPAVSTPTPTPTPTPRVTPTPTTTPGPTATPASTPTPSGGVGGILSTPTPTPAGAVEGISSSAPSGGVGGATAGIPFTGAALPLGLAGGLASAGAGLLLLGRRRRRR
jgi:hypothetical protein